MNFTPMQYAYDVGLVNVPAPVVYGRGSVYAQGLTHLQGGNIIHPIQVSINQTIPPLSTATIVMPSDELLNHGDFAKLTAPNGVTEFYRIRSPEIDYENGTATYELDHAIAEIGDWLVLGNYTDSDITIENAVKKIWGTTSNPNYRGGLWSLDTTGLQGIEGNPKVTLSCDHEDVLTALNEAVDGVPGLYMVFDFSSRPWVLKFATLDTEYILGYSQATLSKNVQSATVTYDDTDLCTKVYYQKNGSWKSIEAEQEIINKYGIVERVAEESGSTASRADYVAQEYLRKNQEPLISIEISGAELSAITGMQNDTFRLGRPLRFKIPEYDTVVTRSITGLDWDDVYGNPLSVQVTCGAEDPKLWSFIRGLRGKKK